MIIRRTYTLNDEEIRRRGYEHDAIALQRDTTKIRKRGAQALDKMASTSDGSEVIEILVPYKK